jgi:ADP-heptose:LPS heptosyltransferase
MNIAVIRPGAIGDTLLTFPILRALRARYANPHITFVGNTAVLPLVQEFGLVEEVSDYQSLQWSELFSHAGIQSPALRSLLRGIDLAICWLRDPDHLVRRNLQQSGVGQIIIAPGRPPQGERIHIVDYVARTVGLDTGDLGDIRRGEGGGEVWGGPLWSPASPIIIHPASPIAIHPGSGGAGKCWPVERFAALIERMWQHQWPVLALFGPDDAAQLAYLQRRLAPPAPEMLTLQVNAPLLEVARRLRQCRCYLGNDSGITHLAAMLGLPTVALFGPSDPAVWRPPGRLVRVIYEPDLASLAVDTVAAQIECHLATNFLCD